MTTPQDNGVINDNLLGFSSLPSLSHIIQDRRVFVYQPQQQWLNERTENDDRDSALLGRVQNRRLIDNLGTDMQVSVPEVFQILISFILTDLSDSLCLKPHSAGLAIALSLLLSGCSSMDRINQTMKTDGY
ncbi:type IV pilus biogenesis protein PilM [Yersinia similis]|uniref:type IV pilus biogenesis protein PilM n=1 Tax=Yersinia similis TaxID=367190 RepID=UPI0004B6CD74|nr:type IV pilus biogenesis protein PilM [Yersinia similis]